MKIAKRTFKLKAATSQNGQSMIEYTVVIMFGFILLTQGPMSNVVTMVSDAIRNNYTGYSYALSMPDFPDSDNQTEYETLLKSYQLTDERIAMLADSPQDYHDGIKEHNIPNPPNIKDMIDDAIKEITNINFP